MANNTYDMVMSRKSDNNIRFADFHNLIIDLGFTFKGQKVLICHFTIVE